MNEVIKPEPADRWRVHKARAELLREIIMEFVRPTGCQQ